MVVRNINRSACLSIFSALLFLITGCSQQPELTKEINYLKAEKGFDVYVRNCESCHGQLDVAPSLAEIDSNYRHYFPGGSRYAEKLGRFLKYPHRVEYIEGAKAKWGEMPLIELSKEDKSAVIYFITAFHFSDKEWMQGMGDSLISEWSNNTQDLDSNLIQLKTKYVKAAKKALGGALKKKISKSGHAAAIGFCNLNASEITNEIGQGEVLSISRVSDRPRNPENEAKGESLEILNKMHLLMQQHKKSPQPMLGANTQQGIQKIYYPILTNNLCLGCHGTSETIKTSILDTLNRLYPNDQARGYQANELRGAWVVEVKD